eukprot:1661277-Prymnesium_polylepis.1
MHQPVLHQDALHRPWPRQGCDPAANHAKHSAVVLLIQMHRRQLILTMHRRSPSRHTRCPTRGGLGVNEVRGAIVE